MIHRHPRTTFPARGSTHSGKEHPAALIAACLNLSCGGLDPLQLLKQPLVELLELTVGRLLQFSQLLVRQAKPGWSCQLKGTDRGSCSFAM
jgi:hypothetical protein